MSRICMVAWKLVEEGVGGVWIAGRRGSMLGLGATDAEGFHTILLGVILILLM